MDGLTHVESENEVCDWRPQVLVVEDTSAYREAYVRALRETGLRVVATDNIQDASRLLGRHRGTLRCILTDIELGDEDFARTNGFDWIMRQANHGNGFFPDFIFISRAKVEEEPAFGMIQNPVKGSRQYPSFIEGMHA